MTAQSKKPLVHRVGATAFSGHETFVFRYAWMKKAVDAAREDGGVFASEQAMVKLGVGKEHGEIDPSLGSRRAHFS